jgi:DNA-binding SARP family transcriptional activator
MKTARYRVLGPIEVRPPGGTWIDVSPAKWRALLSIFVVHSGRVVPASELMRQLWPQKPPSAAGKLVQHYVSRLRRLIGDPRGQVLRTRPHGYELSQDDGESDADRFTALASAGSRALAAGHTELAVRQLREALCLWRGDTAFAGVEGVPSVEIEVFRLAEHRLATVEASLRAGLACGPPEAVIPELQAMVAAHPLRERMCELLMKALYRAGRRCEALAACRELRRILREEHGLDPDDAVQRLEQQILRGERLDPIAAGERLPRPEPAGHH